MTIDKAIDKLQKLSKLTGSKEPCEMGIAALKAMQALGLSFGTLTPLSQARKMQERAVEIRKARNGRVR